MYLISNPVSLRVIDAVARINRVNPDTLPPLYEAVDPDALDVLFAPGQERNSLHVQFSYAGREITVRSAADIEVR